MAEDTLDRVALAALQGERLLTLLRAVRGRNAFHTRRLDAAGVDIEALRLPQDLDRLPFTTKAELVRFFGAY